jgi:phosphoenolpyruvate carboxykinase (GTP)
VLEWIFRRCDGEAEAAETPIGLVPAPGALNVEGLDLAPEALEELLAVDVEQVREEMPQVHEHLGRFGEHLPAAIKSQLDALEQRLSE